MRFVIGAVSAVYALMNVFAFFQRARAFRMVTLTSLSLSASSSAAAAAASCAARAFSCASLSASSSVFPGNHLMGMSLATRPTGNAPVPMSTDTHHSVPLRFMNPTAGPTTERPTPSINATCVATVAMMILMNTGDLWMFSNTAISEIFLLLISLNTCIITKVLKITLFRRNTT